jgi:hypothetical protein
VASGAELKGYSGYSSSNNHTHASHSYWDVITTGSAHLSIWFKTAGNSGTEYYISISNASGSRKLVLAMLDTGVMHFRDHGATGDADIDSTATYDDGVWHKADFVRVSSTERYMYVDGVLITSSTTDAGSLTSSGNIPLGIGVDADGSSASAASSTLALAKLSIESPGANQIHKMYIDEYAMFQANAECLLQSGTTDAVLDVSVDPLGSGKTLVTQTDAITIFDGLVVDSKPTVNSGASEHGKLWGDLRVEINDANCYVTAPAHDQAQVNEMVRGLASNVPGGVDLSKAAAWAVMNRSGSTLDAAFNIKSVTFSSTGYIVVVLATPVKEGPRTPCAVVSVGLGGASGNFGVQGQIDDNDIVAGVNGRIVIRTSSQGNAAADMQVINLIVFGELENE